MARIVRGGLIQAVLSEPATSTVEKIRKSMIDKHVALIARAADQGVQVLCLQELFYGPYFCAEQNRKWYAMTEPVPAGPTTQFMCELARAVLGQSPIMWDRNMDPARCASGEGFTLLDSFAFRSRVPPGRKGIECAVNPALKTPGLFRLCVQHDGSGRGMGPGDVCVRARSRYVANPRRVFVGVDPVGGGWHRF